MSRLLYHYRPRGYAQSWSYQLPPTTSLYNHRFSTSRRGRKHSASVQLSLDIALRVPDGPNAGLHLFDAKFWVRTLTEVGLATEVKDADHDRAAVRAGSYQRSDIYTMKAYRDVIPEARAGVDTVPGVGSLGSLGYRAVGGGRAGRPVG